VCVYSNTAGGAYNITATGDGPSSSFQVSDGSGNFITYQFRWNDVGGTNSGGVNLTSGTILTGQTGADTVSVNCSGGASLNARIRVRFTESDLSTSIGNSYTGNVTISISPE
jgi:hypothetical protein